jgi:hypothetical protein
MGEIAMKTSKEKAVKLIDEKISQFEKLLSKTSNGSFDMKEYDILCAKTVDMLANLFPQEKVKELCDKIRIFWISESSNDVNNQKRLIQKCIIQLEECKETLIKNL